MKIILLFLAALASFTVHAQPPSQTVEQTVRHIYQNYKSDATAPYFGETGERAITSARIQQALTLNDNLTLPGNDSNLLIVFYVQIMPDDFVMQLHRF